MERIIYFSERYINYTSFVPENVQKEQRVNSYQKISLSYIDTSFFIWASLILITNIKKWKKPMILLLIINWLLRATGDLLLHLSSFHPTIMLPIVPANKKNWYIGCAFANIFWTSGEILGDWYFFLRTKVIINDNKKIRPVFIICIIYNITKVYNILFYFIEIPKCIKKYNENPMNFDYMLQLNIRWYYAIIAIQIASFIYDLSIIICLRKNLFQDLKYSSIFEKDSFIDRFKKVSEFRIFISMIAALIFIPILILFIVLMFKYNKSEFSTPLYFAGVDNFRRLVIGINLNLIYIDQILLRCYVDSDQPITKKLLNNIINISNSNFSNSENSENKDNCEISINNDTDGSSKSNNNIAF